MLTPDEVKARAKALMPGLTEDLKDLVSHASCSFPGFPEEPVHEMRRAAIDVLERHGADVHELDLGEGKPAIYGEMAGPEFYARLGATIHEQVTSEFAIMQLRCPVAPTRHR